MTCISDKAALFPQQSRRLTNGEYPEEYPGESSLIHRSGILHVPLKTILLRAKGAYNGFAGHVY